MTTVVHHEEPSTAINVVDGFSLESSISGHVSVKNRKAVGILAYLALNGSGRETRERLAGLLWSDRSEEQARASLRQSLKQLRSALESASVTALRTERQEVALAPGGLDVDLKSIVAGLRRGDVDSALARGEVLPDRILYGYESLDQAFAAWLHVVREQWRSTLIDLLQTALRNESLDHAARRRAAEAIAHIDRTHEEAHRFLITGHARDGNIAAALDRYKELWVLLGDEYDMEPAEETQALIAKIKSGEFERELAAPSEPSLSVTVAAPTEVTLPVLDVSRFEPGGPFKAETYFIDGFRRDLIASLVRFREWVVVDGGERRARDESGRAARTDYQLEGTYFDDAGEVRLVVTLKDVDSRRYIWSEQYILRLDDWFVAQQSLVRRMAVALNVHLTAERIAHQIAEPDLSSEAYNEWLKGQDHLSYWNPEAEARAEQIFREIIAKDPKFAPAYSGLVAIINSRHFKSPGVFRSTEAAQEALAAARRSVDLDPLDTRNQLALAWSNAMNGRFEQAELHFNLAYELNPNSPITLIPCAHGLSFLGRHGLACQLAKRAIEINPLMPAFHWGYILCIRYLARDYDGAIEAAEIAQDAITDLHAWRAAALAMADREEEAVGAVATFRTLVRDRWHGTKPCTDLEIASWFLHCFPIRRREDLEHLREGLMLAGLPAPELEFA